MRQKKILLIDDEVDLCTLVKMNLENSGEYEVTLAHSGQAGLVKVKSTEFDLVITDFKMPGMDGKEVLDILKARNPNLPVIIFSMFFDDASTITREIKKKADGLISKPIDDKQLIDTIKHVLAKSKK